LAKSNGKQGINDVETGLKSNNSSRSQTPDTPKHILSREECGLCKNNINNGSDVGLIDDYYYCEIREIPTPFEKDWKCPSFSRK